MSDSDDHPHAFQEVVGESAALTAAVELARKLGRSGIQNILIEGETGTGKELFARGIHYLGDGSNEPFAAVNCAAIPASLLESELFGHERGAFTDARARKRGLLELAGGGTLLLDEINELPLALQPKLLRVLEERRIRRVGGLTEIPIRCRVISTCNVSLGDAVDRRLFREDLYYRLEGFKISLPPLRKRQGDIELLSVHFLEELAASRLEEPKRLTEQALEALRIHAWPGNIRELKNVLQRAVMLAGEDPEIRADHLIVQRRTAARPRAVEDAGRSSGPEEATGGSALSLQIPDGGCSLDRIEKEAVLQTLRATGGNQSEAARRLEISRSRLARMLDRHELRDELGLDSTG